MLEKHFYKCLRAVHASFILVCVSVTLQNVSTNHALAQAQVDDGDGGGGEGITEGGGAQTLSNPLGDTSLIDLFDILLDAIVLLMIPIIVLMVIYSGFLFVTAQGNTDQISRARTMIGWTLVGALIILAADQILELVRNTVESVSD